MSHFCGIYSLKGAEIAPIVAWRYKSPTFALHVEEQGMSAYLETETAVIFFYGSLFNIDDLRKEFAVPPQVVSTVEVFYNVYCQVGTDVFDKLNGHFAIVIYDKQSQELLLVRDHIGVNALLYYKDGNYLYFASSLTDLLQLPVPRTLDETSLYQYLQLNYVPDNVCIVKHVQKLPEGSYVRLSSESFSVQAYYKMPCAEEKCDISYAQAAEQFEVLLRDAVQRRLSNSMGCFLSGGIDSSVMVALASEYVPRLNTFSIGFKDSAFFDETKYARMMADRYKTDHTEFQLSNEEFFEGMSEMLADLDEPYADSSAIAGYMLCKKTAPYVGSVLSGDGADELLCGYNKHAAELRMRNMGIAEHTVKLLSPLWKMMPKSRSSFFGNKFRQLNRFAEGAKLSEKDRYYRWCSLMDEVSARQCMLHGVDTAEYEKRKQFALQYITKGGSLNEVSYTDLHFVLLGDMTPKVRVMIGRSGLQVLPPMLDRRVVDFAVVLPVSYKITNNIRKRLLKETFRSYLPEELFNRPKHGFEVPMLQWCRTELKPMIEKELLNDDFIEAQGIFNVEEVRKMKTTLFSNNPQETHANIFALLAFQQWWKNNII